MTFPARWLIALTLALLLACGGTARPPEREDSSGARVSDVAVEQPAAPEATEPRYSVEEAGAAIHATIMGGRLPRLTRRGMAPPDSQFAEVYPDGFIPVWVTAAGSGLPASAQRPLHADKRIHPGNLPNRNRLPWKDPALHWHGLSGCGQPDRGRNRERRRFFRT